MSVNRCDLIHREAGEAERRALSWIVDRVRFFNPLREGDLRRFNASIKPFAELVLTSAIARGSVNERRLPSYQDLARFAWNEVFANEAFREHLLTHSASLPAFSIYASLRRCGFEEPRYRRRLESLLETTYVTVVEQLPFVKLQQVHSLSAAGLPLSGLSARSIWRRSLLAAHPSLYPLTTLDAYAITHVLFFLTDFARRRASCFTNDDDAYFRRALPRLLQYYLRRGNWDLSSELLVCLKAVGATDNDVYEDAWVSLLAAQNGDGSFSGPDEDGTGVVNDHANTSPQTTPSDPEDAERRYFYDNYHTTLVALLALLVALPD